MRILDREAGVDEDGPGATDTVWPGGAIVLSDFISR